jgi:Phage major capsid protein E.
MITDPNYSTRTLLAAFEAGPIVGTFLRDTFFGGREYPPTSTIEFDFRRGRRKMAPFVAPLVGGKVMERMGYETRFFKAPRIAPVRALRVPDLEPRLMGETIYSGRTEADRAAELLAEDSEFLDEAISRREEWMCREVLINGKITVTAENGYTQVINFLEYGLPAQNASNHFLTAQLTGGLTWDTAGSDPLLDLTNAKLETIKRSGISPNVALFGTNAAAVFTRNATVKELLDNRRFELGMVAPQIQSDSVVRFGSVPGLELYSYAEYFEDDAGQLFPMLPPNLVMLISTNVPNKIVYGAFTQLEDVKSKKFVTYQASRIPYVYGDEEGGALYYRVTSCPLPMPADVLGFCIIEALPGGAGPFSRGVDPESEGKRPFFESDQLVPQPQLLEEDERLHTTEELQTADEENGGNAESENLNEYTVDELKGIAQSEDVDLKGASTKAEIIKAIKRSRK